MFFPWNLVRVYDLEKKMKTSEEMIAYLVKRIEALENINAAYRMSRTPSGSALDNASATFGWKCTLNMYKEMKEKENDTSKN